MNQKPSHDLTKSLIASYEQCPRRLWLQKHAPEKALVNDSAERIYAIGNEVGALAYSLIPDGIMIETKMSLDHAIIQTKKYIEIAKHPIFESAFIYDGVLVRVDVLTPETDANGQTSWHITEVKSSTKLKDHYKGDLATQLWVLQENGLKIASASIRQIDNSFTLRELGQYDGVFKDTELLESIIEIVQIRDDTVKQARNILSSEEPICDTGSHCKKPFPCEFMSHCSGPSDENLKWPIYELPNNGQKLSDKWAQEGIYDIRDLPVGADLNPMHERMRSAINNDECFIDHKGIENEISGWSYPHIWLDFETIAYAIPRWIGTKPYQQIPFQFSAHIECENGNVEHVEALDLNGEDPRPQIAKALSKLPKAGTVIAWFASFERSRLKELARDFPEYAVALLSLVERTEDLLPITRKNYYHPDQRGSFSIKAVLPTIAPELDYSSLEVKDGGNAQLAYIEASDDNCTDERRSAIAAALKAYCERDTWAMVSIYRGLIGQKV